jgi:hypothetical protein
MFSYECELLTLLWRVYVAADALRWWPVTLFAPATNRKAEHV